jgi:peptidoglycan/LPS O-acetylase OafA/YrhL
LAEHSTLNRQVEGSIPSASTRSESSESSESLTVTGNTARTRPENRAFYPALDGVRALAFLMVFAHHYLRAPWGWAGVDVFFVLSGFLITGILFDTRHDPHRVRNFYIRRTLRIFPLYYAVMGVLLLSSPLLHWGITWRWLVWPAYVGNYARFIRPYAYQSAMQMLADFQPTGSIGHHHLTLFLGHFWSLCVEEQFYLFWPWVVFFRPSRKTLALICAAALPVCLGLRLGGQHLLPGWMLDGEILYRATPLRLDALLLGGLLALAIRGPEGPRLLRLARILFPVALAALAACILVSTRGALLQNPYPYPEWRFTWGLTGIDIVSALLVLVALQPDTMVYKVFHLRPLRWMGRISYGAYVLHDIPHPEYDYLARKLVGRIWSGNLVGGGPAHSITIVTAILALTGTLLMAWLSFRWFESVFLNFKERWTARVID